MIVLDANLLIYACDPETALHVPAYSFVNRVFSGDEMVGIPQQSISAFLRITTQRGVLRNPFPLSEAVALVGEWMNLANVRLLVPGDRYWSLLQRMLIDGNASGRLVTDAEIAALTIEHDGVLQTNDRDFARFPGLRWSNPLRAA